MSNRKGLYSNLHPIISPLGAEPIYGSYSNERTVNSVIQHYEDQGFMKRRNKSERAEDRSKLEALSLMSLEGALTPDFLNAFMGYEYFNRKDYGSDKDYLKSQPRYSQATQTMVTGTQPAEPDPKPINQPFVPSNITESEQVSSEKPIVPTETTDTLGDAIPQGAGEYLDGLNYPTDESVTVKSQKPSIEDVAEATSIYRAGQGQLAQNVREGAEEAGLIPDLANIAGDYIEPGSGSSLGTSEAQDIADRFNVSTGTIKALAKGKEEKKSEVGKPKATTEPTEDQQVTKKKKKPLVATKKKPLPTTGANATSAQEKVEASKEDKSVEQKKDERPEGKPKSIEKKEDLNQSKKNKNENKNKTENRKVRGKATMPTQKDYQKKFGRKFNKKKHGGKSWSEVRAELRSKGEL